MSGRKIAHLVLEAEDKVRLLLTLPREGRLRGVGEGLSETYRQMDTQTEKKTHRQE
jgi:hypothetical protein